MEKALEYYISEDFLIEDLKAREPMSYFYKTGIVATEDSNDKPLLDNITDFVYSKHSYVVTDAKGRIFSYKGNRDPYDGDFIDVSKEEDLGLSKAVIFSSANDANEFIVDTLINNYEIISVEQAFRKDEDGSNKQ